MALEPRAKVIQQMITQPGASPKGCVNFDPAVTSYQNEIVFRNVQGCVKTLGGAHQTIRQVVKELLKQKPSAASFN